MSRLRTNRWWLSCLPVSLALSLLWLPWSAQSAQTNTPSEPVIFRVGMATTSFHNVNHNDAIAAFRVFLETEGHHYGYVYRSDVQIFDDTPDFESAIRREPISLVVMDAWQYFQMDIHPQVKPFFTVSENGKAGRKYLVLTRRDSGLQTLADLRGKAIVKSEMASEGVGEHWLEAQLLASHLGRPEEFFANEDVVAKPTAAVLPVFFGKKPACVVDEASFDVMKELNPQVGQALQVVAASETYCSVVICLSDRGWISEQAKKDTIKALNEMPLTPAGQQILTLFKLDKFVPIDEAQLEPVRQLRATYTQLVAAEESAGPLKPSQP